MAEALGPAPQLDRDELRRRILVEFKSLEFEQILTTQGFKEPASLTSSTDYADIVAAVLEDAQESARMPALLAALYYFREGTAFGTYVAALGLQYPGEEGFESLVVEVDALFDWSALMQGVAVGRHVCLLSIDQLATGTGVLVGADLVLTNHHVVKSLIDTNRQSVPGSQARLTATFDFISTLQPNGLRVANPGVTVPVAARWLEASSLPHPSEVAGKHPADSLNPIVELDYALIRLAQPIGTQPLPGGGGMRSWAALKAPARPLDMLQRVHISQHAAGQPLKGASGRISAVPPHKARVRYKTSTLKVASGSPCWSNEFQLIALHNFGGIRCTGGVENQGVPIDRIIADLTHTAQVGILALPPMGGFGGPVAPAVTPRIWSVGGDYPVLGRSSLLQGLTALVTAAAGGSQVLLVNGGRYSGRTFTRRIIQQFLRPAGHHAVTIDAAVLIDDTPEAMLSAMRMTLGLNEPDVTPGSTLTTRPAEVGRHRLGAFLAQMRSLYPSVLPGAAAATQIWIIFDGLDQVGLADETHDLIAELTGKAGEAPTLRVVLCGYEHSLPSEVESSAETEQIALPTVRDVEFHLQHALEDKLGFVSPQEVSRLAAEVMANASKDPAKWLGDVGIRVRDIVRNARRRDAA